jgi:hypothetical protein
VTDSLLFENKHETQTVHMYEDFVTAEAKISTTLSGAELAGLDDYGIMMMLDKARGELADWGEKIFGCADDGGGQVQIRIARNGAEAAREAEKGEQENKGLAFRRDGELGEHIGYAPVFKERDDLDPKESRADNVVYYGDGEIGKIMLDFQWNEIMRGKGYGEMALPVWDKWMWDNDGDGGNSDRRRDFPACGQHPNCGDREPIKSVSMDLERQISPSQ